MNRTPYQRRPAASAVRKSTVEFRRRDFIYPTAPEPTEPPRPEPDEIAPPYPLRQSDPVRDGEED